MWCLSVLMFVLGALGVLGGVWKVVFGRDGIILNDVLGALGGLGGVLEVMGCFGGFGGALIGVGGGLEGGDGGIFVVSGRLKGRFWRFRWSWGRFGGVLGVLGAL